MRPQPPHPLGWPETIILPDGRQLVAYSSRSPQQRARHAHLCALLGVQFPPAADDYGTATAWEQLRASERAADDRRMAERMGF